MYYQVNCLKPPFGSAKFQFASFNAVVLQQFILTFTYFTFVLITLYLREGFFVLFWGFLQVRWNSFFILSWLWKYSNINHTWIKSWPSSTLRYSYTSTFPCSSCCLSSLWSNIIQTITALSLFSTIFSLFFLTFTCLLPEVNQSSAPISCSLFHSLPFSFPHTPSLSYWLTY